MALVVILAALIFTALTYTPLLPLCREELANTGSVTRVCGPLTAADLPLLGMILLVALGLLWPDLSEGGVAGLISWKRRVEAVESKARVLEEDVRNVEAGLVSPADLASAAAEVERMAPAADTPLPQAAARAEQGSRLLQVWEALRPYQELKIAPGVQSSRSPVAMELAALEGQVLRSVSPLDPVAIRMWQETYQKELRELRLIRNAVAHGIPQQADAVTDAIELAERLKRSLDNLRARVAQAEGENTGDLQGGQR